MRCLCTLLLMSALAPAAAGDVPRVGLVLSGGGARGSAHIGVLKVLEEMRIPIHAIAGTSMGSLVGGVYASGMSAAEMEQRVLAVDWNELLADDPPRRELPMRRKQEDYRPRWDFNMGLREGQLRLPKGALAGQQILLFFKKLAQGADGVESFDELPIPFRAVATDLEDGSMVVFDSGSLPYAMRASMSVPGVFAPLETEDGIFVDGGLVRNLPVDVMRNMDVDVIIAVNLGSSLLTRDQLGTLFGVAGQMIAILTEQNVQQSLSELDPARDVLIRPDLPGISSADFAKAAEAIRSGEAAARKAADELVRFSVGPSEYAAWRSQLAERRRPVQKADAVRVFGLETVNEDLFAGVVSEHTAVALERAKLQQDLQQIYGRGDFERLSYRFTPDGNQQVLAIDAIEKAWGPGYLGLGLGLASDFQGENRLGLFGSYRATWLNALGAEWFSELQVGNKAHAFTEFYQPVSLNRAGFVAPYLSFEISPLSVFVDQDRIARYDIKRARLGLDVGSTILERFELRLGAYWGQVRQSLDTGSLLLPEFDDQDSGVRARAFLDTLDSVVFPRSGQSLYVNLRYPLEALGADREYLRAEAAYAGAFSRGDHTLLGQVRLGTSSGDPLPYYDQFALGGFLRLPGYSFDQLRSGKLAYGGLVYYYELATLPQPLGRGVYVGGSVEAAQLEDTVERLTRSGDRYGGSVFIGADTWLGPLSLAWGFAENGENAFYVFLGLPR